MVGLQAQKSPRWHHAQDMKQNLPELKVGQFPNTILERQQSQIKRSTRMPKNHPLASQNSVIVNDSVYDFEWNINNNDWKSEATWRSLYTYDSQGRMIGERYCERNSSGEWRNIYRSFLEYDGQRNRTVWINDNWDTLINQWIPAGRDTATYNSGNVLIKEKYYVYNTINQSWFLAESYLYNDDGYEIEFFGCSWDDETYEIYSGYKGTISRNAYNKPLEEIGSNNYLSGPWELWYKDTYSYINDTIIEQATEYEWTGSEWQGEERDTYTYNNDGQLWQHLTEINSIIDLTWMNASRITYSYLDDLVSIELDEEWDFSLNAWVNDSKVTFAYYPNKLVQNITTQKWDDADWENSSLSSYTYNDNDHMTEYVYQRWVNSSWVESHRMFYIYNNNGNIVEYGLKYFDTNGTVTAGWRYLRDYNDDNLITSYTSQNWNTETADWQNELKSVYYYSPVNGIISPKSETIFCEFQNPYITGTTISCTLLSGNKNYLLSLFDIKGNSILQKQIKGNCPFSIDKPLPEGLYMLVINSENERVYTKKVIMQKP